MMRAVHISKRAYSSKVRVRFAPSPTGKLHIGGLRTALYNYLFARKHNGVFILRIEDTDQDRLQPDSISNIIESLKWAKLEPDIGPHNENDAKSDLGPVLQSKRLSLYQTYADQLIKNGKAYMCFCDPTRLELLRKNAAKRHEKLGYDGKCKHLTSAQVEKLLSEKKPYVVRFKFENVDREVVFDDMAYGVHKSVPARSEGDFVILKSDRFPTYHFANVVDDHLMKITHVLRGQEWLLSVRKTAKHILIYEAFGWKVPHFAHLPLICNNDGTKLSKRQNDIDVMSFRRRGYLPESLLVYLTTLGGGCRSQIALNSNDTNNDKKASADDNSFNETLFRDVDNVRRNLIENFDETRMSNRPVKLSLELLDNMNRRFLRSMWLVGDHRNQLKSDLKTLLKSKYTSINEHYLEDVYLTRALEWSFERIHRLNDLVDDPSMSFLWMDALNLDPTNFDSIKNSSHIVEDLILHLKNIDFVSDQEALKKELGKIFDEIKKKTKSKMNLWKLARLFLIGSEVGPPVVEIFALLGKENSIYRLNLAKDIISKH